MKKITPFRFLSFCRTTIDKKKIQHVADSSATFLYSLPYPAMLVSLSTRQIVAANNQAVSFGVKIGGYCWRDFMNEDFLDAEAKKIAQNYPNNPLPEHALKCAFCCADHCYKGDAFQYTKGLKLHNRIWDTFWVKFNDQVFLHYFVDVTDKVKVEKDLHESELYLTQIRQIMGLATFTFNLRTRNWEGSEVISDIYGFSSFEAKKIDDWMEAIHPEMKQEVVTYFNEVVQNELIQFKREFRIVCANTGAVKWVNCIGTILYDEHQHPDRMVGAIWDITARKEEQSRITRNLIFTEVLLHSIPSPVFFMDAELRFIGCNEAFSEQMGIGVDEIKGKTIYQIWPYEQSFELYNSDIDLIVKKGRRTIQTTIVDKHKQRRNIILVKNVFFDENEKVAGLVGIYHDITEIQLTEEALRKSEQMLQTVLDHFPGVVFWKDRDSVYMGCNKTFSNGAGLWCPSEIVGKTDYELPWKETEATAYRTDDWDVISNDKGKFHIVEKQHQADGKVVWFDTSKIPLKDENGKIMGIIGVSNNITEQKMAEVQRDFLLACVENADDMVVVKDLNSRIVSANRAWLLHYGESELETFINKTEEEALGLCEISKDNYEEEIKAQHLNQGEFLISERSVRDIEGVETIYQVKRYPIFDDDNVLIGTGTIESDITESKKIEETLRASEQKYVLLAENITDGIFTCRDGIIEYVNKSFLNILGYKSMNVVGKPLIDIIAPERKVDFEFFLSIDDTTDQLKSIETECVKKNNEHIYVELFLNYVSKDKLMYGVLHDVTQKRQIQQQNMLKAIIQTEEKERAYFSKELHDGLGPLLSTIKLYLQWSMRPKSNKSHVEIIEKAEEVLEEALVTVKEISNRLSPHLLVNYGLSSAIQSFVHKLEETSSLKVRIDSNLSRRIETEVEVALYRVVIECINNTVKYAKAKHITITLKDMGDRIQLSYQDDGKGFDIINKLDEKKGLGLYNLQNRIKTIGGEIMMFSKPHEGVNYHIVVPVSHKSKQVISHEN